jgi:hypothetical protein
MICTIALATNPAVIRGHRPPYVHEISLGAPINTAQELYVPEVTLPAAEDEVERGHSGADVKFTRGKVVN